MEMNNTPPTHPRSVEDLLAPLRRVVDQEVEQAERTWGPIAIAQANLVTAEDEKTTARAQLVAQGARRKAIQAQLVAAQTQLCHAQAEKQEVSNKIGPYETELGVEEVKAAAMETYVGAVGNLINEGQATATLSANVIKELKTEWKARRKDVVFLQFQIRKKQGVLVGLRRKLKQVERAILGNQRDILQLQLEQQAQ